MNRLTNHDLLLLKRYFNKEASQADMEEIGNMLRRNPPTETNNLEADKEFDEEQAFLKLHERLKGENLI